MSKSRIAALSLLFCLAFTAVVQAQDSPTDSDANEANIICKPRVAGKNEYRTDKPKNAYFKENNKNVFNNYGTPCKDMENKDVAASGYCTSEKTCFATKCAGTDCKLPTLKTDDVLKSLDSSDIRVTEEWKETGIWQDTDGNNSKYLDSDFDSAMEPLLPSDSANNLAEALKEAESQSEPSIFTRARDAAKDLWEWAGFGGDASPPPAAIQLSDGDGVFSGQFDNVRNLQPGETANTDPSNAANESSVFFPVDDTFGGFEPGQATGEQSAQQSVDDRFGTWAPWEQNLATCTGFGGCVSDGMQGGWADAAGGGFWQDQGYSPPHALADASGNPGWTSLDAAEYAPENTNAFANLDDPPDTDATWSRVGQKLADEESYMRDRILQAELEAFYDQNRLTYEQAEMNRRIAAGEDSPIYASGGLPDDPPAAMFDDRWLGAKDLADAAYQPGGTFDSPEAEMEYRAQLENPQTDAEDFDWSKVAEAENATKPSSESGAENEDDNDDANEQAFTTEDYVPPSINKPETGFERLDRIAKGIYDWGQENIVEPIKNLAGLSTPPESFASADEPPAFAEPYTPEDYGSTPSGATSHTPEDHVPPSLTEEPDPSPFLERATDADRNQRIPNVYNVEGDLANQGIDGCRSACQTVANLPTDQARNSAVDAIRRDLVANRDTLSEATGGRGSVRNGDVVLPRGSTFDASVYSDPAAAARLENRIMTEYPTLARSLGGQEGVRDFVANLGGYTAPAAASTELPDAAPISTRGLSGGYQPSAFPPSYLALTQGGFGGLGTANGAGWDNPFFSGATGGQSANVWANISATEPGPLDWYGTVAQGTNGGTNSLKDPGWNSIAFNESLANNYFTDTPQAGEFPDVKEPSSSDSKPPEENKQPQESAAPETPAKPEEKPAPKPAPATPKPKPVLSEQGKQAQSLRNSVGSLQGAFNAFMANPNDSSLAHLAKIAGNVSAQGAAFNNKEIQDLTSKMGGLNQIKSYDAQFIRGKLEGYRSQILGGFSQARTILKRLIR